MVRAVLVLSCSLAACSHEDVISLAEFGDAFLDVIVTQDGTDVTVNLWRDVAGDTCYLVEDQVTANLDGDPLDVVSHGAYSSGTWSSASSCELPTFRATTTASASPSSQIEITDGTVTITVEVASLRAVRRFAATDAMHVGADAHLAWSVATDAIEPGSIGGATPSPGAAWNPAQGMAFSVGDGTPSGAGATLQGTTLVLAIPSNAPLGPGVWSISPLLSATVLRCDGVQACSAPPVDPPDVPGTLVP